MTRISDDCPLSVDKPDLIHRLREMLREVGFDEAHVSKRLGVPDMAGVNTGVLERPRLLRRTRGDDPLDTIVKLFLIGVPIETEVLGRALGGVEPAELAGIGLIDIDGNVARRAVMLWPADGLIIAHDAKAPDGSQRRDHVLGVTGATQTLSKTMLRRDARWTLDLGTGSGILALLASRHSERVLATDLNARAVAMTQFNTLFNDITNVETAVGDLFEPSRDLGFDLIVANPPFVISPENAHLFRDSGLQLDQICERLIRQAPLHLAEGGYAQVLCNWARMAGQSPYERVVEWVKDSGCDAWICHTHTDEIDHYADFWLRQYGENDPAKLAGRFGHWIEYYEREGIEAIDSGIITLRRRAQGPNWTRLDTSRRLNQPNGVAIQVGFEARDLLDSLDGVQQLLTLRLRARSELRLSQTLKPTQEGWMVEDAKCILGQALRFEGEMNQAVFHLLTLCRGRQTLAEVIQQVAARLGQSPDTVVVPCVEAVRNLLDQGFLWPADELSGS